MKAIIRVVTAQKQFTEDQIKFMKRCATAMIENHQLSVVINMKVKKTKKLKLKAV